MKEDPSPEQPSASSPPSPLAPLILPLLFFLVSTVCALLLLRTNSYWLWALLAISAVLAFRREPTPSRIRSSTRKWRLALALVVLVPLVFRGGHSAWRRLVAKHDGAIILSLVTKEELILQLTPKLKELSSSLLNLKLPDPKTRDQFDQNIWIFDLSPAPAQPRLDLKSVAVILDQLPLSSEGLETSPEELDLWRPFLNRVAYFEQAKFYLIDGHFAEDGYDLFEGEVGFTGLARIRSGEWTSITARQSVQWKRLPTSNETTDPEWRIAGWEMRSFQTAASRQLLFVESLNQTLPNPRDLQRARQSLHQQASLRYYAGGARDLPSPYFAPISANQKPGISVVDIDQDGFDDLYIMVRMGENQLLHNRGDGTFEEIASQVGLNIPGHSTCGIFADFDNDGDPDLMLARTLERTLYLENVKGGFVSKPPPGVALPFLAISMAAADYNGDGLLDIYISTYRPAVLAGAGKSGGDANATSHWPDEFLPPIQAQEYYRRDSEANDGPGLFSNFLNQVGPPNLLLVNRGGGRFEIAPQNPQLELWRNTLQATWADFDDDGDPDLYVANDWARDHLFRNDGTNGFTDITQAAGTDAFGFAMGVTWGDYDNDSHQDLYVSTMYSKAGKRITAGVQGLDPNYAQSASGNYLYRQNAPGRFDLVSGHEPPALAVADAGWSWGGQFADIDNDSFLDLYALSGYFTAPKTAASEVDL